MFGPGAYRPDPTEGITAIADLPPPEIVPASRTYTRQAPRRFAVVTDLGIEVGKDSMGIDDAQLITHRHVPIAFGKGRTGHSSGLLWHRVNRTGVE